MSVSLSVSGKALRMRRLTHAVSGKCLMVPLDHSLADGPIATPALLRNLVTDIARHGGNAVVMHKGRARFLPPEALGDLALVVHLNGCTRYAQDSNAKELFSSVEDAISVGADAVSLHINMGAETETRQLRDLARVASECQRWSLPLMAMVYPRGPGIEGLPSFELLGHAANLAAELGADIVKLPYSGDPISMARVIDNSPLPVLVAGGAKLPESEFVKLTANIMQSGAWGIAAGRNVFNSTDVAGLITRLAHTLHGETQSAFLASPIERAAIPAALFQRG